MLLLLHQHRAQRLSPKQKLQSHLQLAHQHLLGQWRQSCKHLHWLVYLLGIQPQWLNRLLKLQKSLATMQKLQQRLSSLSPRLKKIALVSAVFF